MLHRQLTDHTDGPVALATLGQLLGFHWGVTGLIERTGACPESGTDMRALESEGRRLAGMTLNRPWQGRPGIAKLYDPVCKVPRYGVLFGRRDEVSLYYDPLFGCMRNTLELPEEVLELPYDKSLPHQLSSGYPLTFRILTQIPPRQGGAYEVWATPDQILLRNRTPWVAGIPVKFKDLVIVEAGLEALESVRNLRAVLPAPSSDLTMPLSGLTVSGERTFRLALRQVGMHQGASALIAQQGQAPALVRTFKEAWDAFHAIRDQGSAPVVVLPVAGGLASEGG